MKIVCVGNPKTATTSLQCGMQQLGYASAGFDAQLMYSWLVNGPTVCVEPASKFDFLKDWPWRQCYQSIDNAYAGCKFILTLRNPTQWVKSYIQHITKDASLTDFHDLMTAARIRAYGFDPFQYIYDESFLIDNLYERQNQDIRDYFAKRPADLLEIDFTIKPEFEPLCEFLGIPAPRRSFPHENRQSRVGISDQSR
jgi:hypothetical protein